MSRIVMALCLLSTVLAGCTGGFEIQQEEPLQIEVNGEPNRVQVKEADGPQRIVVENPQHADTVDVAVEVRPMSEGPVRIEVVVEDSETGEVLAREEISVPSGNETTTTTSTTTTTTTTGTNSTSSTESTESSNVIVKNVFVEVHGKDNFIVLTDAVEGDADVSITAKSVVMESDGNQTA